MDKDYNKIVATAKEAARDTLRMEKISKWLTRKADLERLITEDKESHTETVAKLNLKSDIALFEATHLDDAHPDKTNRIASAQKTKDANDELITHFTKNYEDRLDADYKRLDEINKALEEWNTGVRKVDLDALNALTKKYVDEAVLNDLLAKLSA